MSRTYSHILKCGCIVAEMDTDGWEGLLPCSVEYYTQHDLDDPVKEQKYLLHERCWREHERVYNEKRKERRKKNKEGLKHE